MESPRSGFRRAAATSWALAGIGIAGVGGASVLAYGDTVKPVSADAQVDAVQPAQVDLGSNAPLNIPPAPSVVAPSVNPLPPPLTPAAPPPAEFTPEKTVEQAPVQTYTPRPEYTPEPTVEPAPVTREAPPTVVKPPSTTRRRALTPTTVMSPNYSPSITRSSGS